MLIYDGFRPLIRLQKICFFSFFFYQLNLESKPSTIAPILRKLFLPTGSVVRRNQKHPYFISLHVDTADNATGNANANDFNNFKDDNYGNNNNDDTDDDDFEYVVRE